MDVPAGEKPQSAQLLLTVDDQFTLFVNGKQIGDFAQIDGWKHPQRYDLLPHLQSGENIIAVAAKNIESLAGVCAKITIKLAGKQQAIVSDRHWKAFKQPANGWNKVGFDDSAWHDAFEVAAFGEGVWGNAASNAANGPVPMLRKSFNLGKTIASARLYATALGLYELRINGGRVGDYALRRNGPIIASGPATRSTTWPRCSKRATMCSPAYWPTAGIAAISATAASSTSARRRPCWHNLK